MQHCFVASVLVLLKQMLIGLDNSFLSFIASFLIQRDAGNVGTKPKAYLNVVLLDETIKSRNYK